MSIFKTRYVMHTQRLLKISVEWRELVKRISGLFFEMLCAGLSFEHEKYGENGL